MCSSDLAEPAVCCAVPSRSTAVAAAAPDAAAAATAADPLAQDQVARLGAELFGRHLLAVEVAGVLLLAALIGAIAVVSRGEAALEEDRRTAIGRAAR